MKINLLHLGIALLALACQSPKSESENKTPETTSPMSSNPSVTDYLHVPGPISFGQKSHSLSWSSHPTDNYFKQEYHLSGANPEHYDQMIILELATGDLDPQAIADGKSQEIAARRNFDPVANEERSVNKATGEILLHFMLSEGTGKDMIVEWNSYRYKSYVGPNGERGLMLFGLSKRGYGPQAQDFVADMQANQRSVSAAFETLDFPNVRL